MSLAGERGLRLVYDGNLGARVISQCAAERILVMKLLRGGEPFRNGIYSFYV